MCCCAYCFHSLYKFLSELSRCLVLMADCLFCYCFNFTTTTTITFYLEILYSLYIFLLSFILMLLLLYLQLLFVAVKVHWRQFLGIVKSFTSLLSFVYFVVCVCVFFFFVFNEINVLSLARTTQLKIKRLCVLCQEWESLFSIHL